MGEVIRMDAAPNEVFADLRKTAAAARARKGVFAEYAEMKLEGIIGLVATLEAEEKAAQAVLAPLLEELEAEDDAADLVVNKVADEVWNALGRPATDAAYDLLFPGGNVFYVKGDVSKQPTRMGLLSKLLRLGVHPRLDRALARRLADEVDAARARLADRVAAAADPRENAELVERTIRALGRTAGAELAGYKRLLKSIGVSEADIHDVIPDRPRTRAAKEPRKSPETPS